MTDTQAPEYGKFDPNTFTLPDANWPTADGMTAECFACGDACHPDQCQFTLNRHGMIADTIPDGSTVGMYHRPACNACYQIWSVYGYYGPEALDEYLNGTERAKVLDDEERARHLGVSYYRVIADRAQRGASRETVFADAWQEENANQRILRRLMLLPCGEKDAGAHRAHEGLVNRPHYQRNAAGRPLTDHECAIVATAMQWLGTNVGFAWLQDTLGKAGWELHRSQTKEAL